MNFRDTKAAFTTAWALIVILAAWIGNLTSTANWAVWAVLAAIPPAVFSQLWNAPAPSMSESIRTALKD